MTNVYQNLHAAASLLCEIGERPTISEICKLAEVPLIEGVFAIVSLEDLGYLRRDERVAEDGVRVFVHTVVRKRLGPEFSERGISARIARNLGLDTEAC